MTTEKKLGYDLNTRIKVKKLKQAIELLNIGWCRGHDAVDEHGNSIGPRSTKAVGWCAVGSIYAAAHKPSFHYDYFHPIVSDVAETIKKSYPKFTKTSADDSEVIFYFNDKPEVQFEQVIECFEKTIERLKDNA